MKKQREILARNGIDVVFRKTKATIDLVLRKNSSQVGCISLVKSRKYYYTYSAEGIPRYLRGKGVGLYLYSRLIRYALRQGIKIRSSHIMERNSNSNAVWKRLSKVFNVKRQSGYYFVLGKND